jgi:hypothetical protein
MINENKLQCSPWSFLHLCFTFPLLGLLIHLILKHSVFHPCNEKRSTYSSTSTIWDYGHTNTTSIMTAYCSMNTFQGIVNTGWQL